MYILNYSSIQNYCNIAICENINVTMYWDKAKLKNVYWNISSNAKNLTHTLQYINPYVR